ncbi:hypothetical protein LTR74_009387 [Friedmanniomyces endolithicus]|nr:hypothetical protein LTR74_009387 [Friedmanniomyces endolithicus]
MSVERSAVFEDSMYIADAWETVPVGRDVPKVVTVPVIGTFGRSDDMLLFADEPPVTVTVTCAIEAGPEDVRGVVLAGDGGTGQIDIVEGEVGTVRDVPYDGGIADGGGELLVVCWYAVDAGDVAPEAVTGTRVRIELLVLILISATALPEPMDETCVAEIEELLNATGEALVGITVVSLNDVGGVDVVSIVVDTPLLVSSLVMRVIAVRLDGCSVIVLETSAANVAVALMLTLDGSGSEAEMLLNAAMGKLVDAGNEELSAAEAGFIAGVVDVGIGPILLVCESGSSVGPVSWEAVELATVDTAVVSEEASPLANPPAGDGEAERLVTVTRPVVNIEVLTLAWEDASSVVIWLRTLLEVVADGVGNVERGDGERIVPLSLAEDSVVVDSETADDEVTALQMTLTIASPSKPAASNVLGSKPAQVCASRVLC